MAVGRFSRIILGTGLTGTDNADDTITLEASGGSGDVASDVIWNAKGDLAVGTAADTAARLAVGSNAQVLTADSGESTGVKWATPSVGAAGAVTLLHTLTLGSAGTFDQSSISGSYNDLILVLIARGSDAGSFDEPRARFNNDSGANYYTGGIQANGTTATVSELIGATGLRAGLITAGAALASSFGISEITVYGYASTTWKKALAWKSFELNNTTSGNAIWRSGGGVWNSTAAITRVQMFGNATANMATGSQLRIYGRL